MRGKAASVRLRWRGDIVRENGKEAAKIGMVETMEKAAEIARELCPVAFGELRDSIVVEKLYVRQGQVFGRWGAYIYYALYVEKGTGPHMPPVDALRPWAGKVLGDPELAWPVAINISKYGTQAQPFLEPAANRAYQQIGLRVENAWRHISARRGSGA
jgi:hypothetical protein